MPGPAFPELSPPTRPASSSPARWLLCLLVPLISRGHVSGRFVLSPLLWSSQAYHCDSPSSSLFCCFYLKPPAFLPSSVQPAPVSHLWSDSFPVHRTRARVILQRAGLTPPASLSRSLSWRDVAVGRASPVFHFASPASWPAPYPQRPLPRPVPSCPDFS